MRDLKSAERTITWAWRLSAIGIGLYLVVHLNVVGLADVLTRTGAYLFLPWIFPSVFAIPLYFVVGTLTYLLYRRSRVTAVLIFVIYLLTKWFIFYFLHQLTPLGTAAWLASTVLWAVIFGMAILGTFAWHRLSSRVRQ